MSEQAMSTDPESKMKIKTLQKTLQETVCNTALDGQVLPIPLKIWVLADQLMSTVNCRYDDTHHWNLYTHRTCCLCMFVRHFVREMSGKAHRVPNLRLLWVFPGLG